MELGDFAKAIGPGLVSDVIVKSIRSVLNGEIKQVRPGQLVYAIENNLSLWEMTGNNITAIAGNIPPKMIEAGRPMYRKAISDCGNATNLDEAG